MTGDRTPRTEQVRTLEDRASLRAIVEAQTGDRRTHPMPSPFPDPDEPLPFEPMTGTYTVTALPSKWAGVRLEVDVSMLLPKGQRSVVLGPYDLCDSLSVWPAFSLNREKARVLMPFVGVPSADELAWSERYGLWLNAALQAPVVRAGRAPLTDAEVRILGIEAGDELLVIGCGEHLEIWRPDRWAADEERLTEDLAELLGTPSED